MTAQQGVLIGIERLKRHGFTFFAVSGRLRVSPGKDAKMTSDRLAWIEKNKDAILECLEPAPAAPGKADSAAILPPEADNLRHHTCPEFERLILCRISHGPDTLAAICAGTDETELAAALVLCDMERRGLIRIVYRDTDTQPYYEESIIQAH